MNSKIEDPDARLVEQAVAGDFEAFDRLVARHEQRVYRFALRFLGNIEDAEEVVQETFLSALKGLDRFRRESKFSTWLMRIATNHALKLQRKRRGGPSVPLENEETGEEDYSNIDLPEYIAKWRYDPLHHAQEEEVGRLIEQALEGLDSKYRAVFLLRDVEGLSTEETADALGISISNTKVRLLRARLMLREELTRLFGDETTQVARGVHH